MRFRCSEYLARDRNSIPVFISIFQVYANVTLADFDTSNINVSEERSDEKLIGN